MTTGIYLGQAFGGFGATIAGNFSWQWTFHFFGMIGVAYSLVLILCQFVSPRYRATGYGLMNLAGISAGALITTFLGKSADAGNMRQDFAMLSIVVAVAIVLQLVMLKPVTANKTENQD